MGIAVEAVGRITGEMQRLLKAFIGEMEHKDIEETFALRHVDYFRGACLIPALIAAMIEMTIPGKPTSCYQKGRHTQKEHYIILVMGGKAGEEGK